jgi:hypothetical protein
LAGVLIVHVHVLVPVHDAFLTNAGIVKLHAGLVYEYVYRFAVNVYASSANDQDDSFSEGAPSENTCPSSGSISSLIPRAHPVPLPYSQLVPMLTCP